MLTISDPMKGAGREDYYLALAAEDYYADGLEKPGYWRGKGATWLGLEGKVERTTLSNLLNGMSPDGLSHFVQNAGAPNRQRCWDLTFSVPKSVSVLWALATPEIRREIEAAHKAAVARAISYIEREAGITRRGKGGAIKERAALVFAAFQHSTSRALDPQIHTHTLLVNLGLRADGTTGSIQSLDFFRLKKAAGRVHLDELACQLQERLRVEILPEKVGFHIRGVPHKLCREFSKRRRQIESKLAQWGATDAVSAKRAAILSRTRKTNVPQDQLFPRWRQVAESFGWTAEQIRTVCHQQPSQPIENGKRDARKTDANRIKSEPRKLNPPIPRGENGQQKMAADSAHQFGSKRGTPNHEKSRERFAQTEDHRTQPASEPATEQSISAIRKPFVRVEWRLMLPRARRSKIAYGWVTPRIVIGRGRRLPRWEKLLWKKELVLDEIRLQERNLFRTAPTWSPARKLKLPVIRIGEQRSPWEGKPLWRKELMLGEVRIQERLMFPDAPKWSPFHDFKIPALRAIQKVPASAQLSQSKSNSHSHSH